MLASRPADRRPLFSKELSHVLDPGLAEGPLLEGLLLGPDPGHGFRILQDVLETAFFDLLGVVPKLNHELRSALAGRQPRKIERGQAAFVFRIDPVLAEAANPGDPCPQFGILLALFGNLEIVVGMCLLVGEQSL